MYKLKIMNFRPYEYEVLYNQLEQLGNNGYYTDDLSLVSIFKKVNHSVSYKIDFLNTKGLKKTDKRKHKEIFYDPYLDKDYHPIYNKRGMYVFVGEQKYTSTLDLKKKKEYIDFQTIFQYIWNTIGALILLIAFSLISLHYSTIDTFSTYGITIVYGGIILTLITCLYRCCINSLGMFKFKNKIIKNQKSFSLSSIKKTRLVYLLLSVLSCILIIGGLIEDTTNAKNFTLNENPMITLKDIGITSENQSSSQKHSSFTVPASYQYIEMNDDSIIYTKQYHLSSKEKATQLVNDFNNNPNQYLCTKVETKNNIIYGYSENTVTTLIIQKQNIVSLVSFDLKINDNQISKIIQFYS